VIRSRLVARAAANADDPGVTVRPASRAFTAWVERSVAPIAHAHGLKGKGPTFRKRDGSNWVVFSVERRRMDPAEAAARTQDPHVEFRLDVGASVPATRPAWDDRVSQIPSAHDVTIHSPSLALAPPDGEFWHVFDADDEAHQAALTELIRIGLAEALETLGRVDARRILDLRLELAGPLEDLAPGQAEELLALADDAGDVDVRNRIVEALRREPTDPRSPDDRRAELTADLRDVFGGDVGIHVLLPPADDDISKPWRPRRRLRKTKAKLIADLASDRRYPRRLAASQLGGWDQDPDVVVALRSALDHPDAYTRLSAALSLGQVADADPQTWGTVRGFTDSAAASPSDLGEAIVLLARLDLRSRRDEAMATLSAMEALYPAWTRRLRALRGLLAS
jgi:HEAT repeat protein